MKPSRLAELSPSQCRELLRSARVGRLVFTERAMPAVHPVNYVLDGNDVVVRTDPGATLDAAARGDVLAFEVDEIDRDTCSGWSVLVVGRASLIVDIDELVDLADVTRRPWAEDRREHVIRIAGERITGRRVRLEPVPAP
jgi:uncharacterized protein